MSMGDSHLGHPAVKVQETHTPGAGGALAVKMWEAHARGASGCRGIGDLPTWRFQLTVGQTHLGALAVDARETHTPRVLAVRGMGRSQGEEDW